MQSSSSLRRRLTWTGVGFAVGYVAVYALFLSDAMTTPHFEALYGGSRPQGVLAWLRFQHVDEVVFLLAGLVIAALAFLASFAVSPRGSDVRAT